MSIQQALEKNDSGDGYGIYSFYLCCYGSDGN